MLLGTHVSQKRSADKNPDISFISRIAKALERNWNGAEKYANELLSKSRWSPAFASYMVGVFLTAQGRDPKRIAAQYRFCIGVRFPDTPIRYFYFVFDVMATLMLWLGLLLLNCCPELGHWPENDTSSASRTNVGKRAPHVMS